MTGVGPCALVSSLCAIVIVFIGASALAGWTFNVERLVDVLPGYANMKGNTAVAFIASGLGLLVSGIRGQRSDRFRLAMAAIAGLLGGLTMIEYSFHVDLHLDQLIFADHAQIIYPGRMAQVSAVNFTLAGIALVLANYTKWARRGSQIAALFIGATAFVSMVGYFYGVTTLYGGAGVSTYKSMALQTGVGFLVLAIGLLLVQRGSHFTGLLEGPEWASRMTRRALPFVVALPVVLGWLYLKPALDLGTLRFGMALFAVTLSVTGAAGLVIGALLLNRGERQRDASASVLLVSNREIERRERELRLITDSLPTLISYIDVEGRLIRVNRTYEAWWGRPAAELEGQLLRDLLGEEYWASTESARHRAAAGETVTFETIYPTIRGSRRARITYAPDIANEPGADGPASPGPHATRKLRGIVCMVLDVEDQHKAERALMESEKLAVVGRMASSIAHEINNPLEAVTNLLYLTADEVRENPVATEYVELAQSELARVSQIVVQTLRFHRQATDPAPCLLSDLVVQVLTLYHGRIGGASVTVERRFREEVPVQMRDGEIRQVIANLIGNSVDAMAGSVTQAASLGRPGGGRLLVRVQAVDGGRRVALTIADTGSGIPESMRERMFHPFETTKGATGSGLGLWVSKEIIDRHCGLIQVRSEEGRGTVFRITFPVDGPQIPTTIAN